MASLNIKDPRVYELAAELARRRGTSMTAAIRGALEEGMAREVEQQSRRQEERLERVRRASADLRAGVGGPVLPDDALYDPETGLPW
ncbi:MAG TPA: hypothetical protein DHV14_10410 [Micrococcales bacterium]|uniref:type II toxin-antitoxin system VapB family antitoxin n=1 Tax=Miniimonas arenae TaxID=676201 RepID=UPI000EE504E7|nr:type II toxin-antitoxin system VapB family antitoxin [Miniimonas arenae]HCX85522.1 hypothetical protein [Micrococcales bacterium]